MALRYYLFIVFVVTLLALGWLVVTIFNVDPTKANSWVLSGFFTSLFLTIAGVSTFVSFFIRVKLSNNEVIFANFPLALRQAVEIASVIVALSFLQSIRTLNLWTIVLVAIIAVLIEMFFRTWKKK